MARFCYQCGKEIGAGVRFCANCGAKQPEAGAGAAPVQITPASSVTANAVPPVSPAAGYAGNGAVRLGIPLPGFSDRVNHPEITAAVKKNRKAGAVFGLILVPIPIIGFVIYSIVSGQMQIGTALIAGGAVSAVILILSLISLASGRASNSYEAVVLEQKTVNRRHDNGNGETRDYTEYQTVVQTTDGKTKTIKEREGSMIQAYSYLKPGDRFRFHPQFAFPYERYDKAAASCLYCVKCGRKNPVEADRCSKCGAPLLK